MMRSPYWFYGSDDGSWELAGRPVLAFKRAGFDWEMAPALSGDNQRRNFRVEGATVSNDGFRGALVEIVEQHPELFDWVIRFDGPWLLMHDVLGQPPFSWTATFYHGTSEAALPFIRQRGICPRDITGSRPTYGGEDKAGRSDAVYLTTELGMAQFAARDASRVTRSPGVVLAIHGVDPRKVVPDEDSKEATARASVDRMGSFGVVGCVPPEDVSVAYVWRDSAWHAVAAKVLGREHGLAGWRDITPKMRQRVRRVLKDWQRHARPFEDTAYWSKRFLPFADVFAHTLPARPMQLFRNERTDIDNRYTDRFTSWSRRPDAVEGFGWGQRRMVTAVFKPEDILVDFINLDLDTEGFEEVIVRPGRYSITPWLRWLA
jgi:hypothetical protein